MDVITDVQITSYTKEKKKLHEELKPRFKDRGTNYCFDKEIKGEYEHTFKIIIRQSKINPLDFSVIFGVLIGNKVFRIKRYNGDHGCHTNKIEGTQIKGFHIHKATERYQQKGFQEDGYAEKTTKYANWTRALGVMLQENNFEIEVDEGQIQTRLNIE